MATTFQHAAEYLASLLAKEDMEGLAAKLKPDTAHIPPHIPGATLISQDAVERRWQLFPSSSARAELLEPHTVQQMAAYEHNIENFIGTVKMPVGLAGPLRVRGIFAQGDFYVPLATTEAALVASYSRGAMLITEVGGASAMLLNEGVSRSPGFTFNSLAEAGRFVAWLLGGREEIRQVAERTTRFGKLIDIQISFEGNHVYIILIYTTGDAAGQNMATIATEAVMKWILDNTPIKPRVSYIEANLSGDKKASTISLQTVRGRKVTAEVKIPSDIVRKRLHTTAEAMTDYARFASLGGVLSGTLGVQGHYANGLAAMFIACGQDAACVAEAAVGITRMEVTDDGSLYVSVTLPNLIVGSVGGGTKLPSQQACLDIMGLAGAGHARALAEVTAALCLAGEISIIGAICSGEFTRAHKRLARGTHPI